MWRTPAPDRRLETHVILAKQLPRSTCHLSPGRSRVSAALPLTPAVAVAARRKKKEARA